MEQHLVTIVDNALAPEPVELGCFVATSFDQALEKAGATVRMFRSKDARKAGYRIEDFYGRIVLIGPGIFDDG